MCGWSIFFQGNALSGDAHIYMPLHLGQGAPVLNRDRHIWTYIRTEVFHFCVDWSQGAHSLTIDVNFYTARETRRGVVVCTSSSEVHAFTHKICFYDEA